MIKKKEDALISISKRVGLKKKEYPTFDSSLWENKDFVHEAVKYDGMLLKQASPKFWDNKIIVKAACKQNIRAFQAASERIKNDLDFVLKLVKIDGTALLWVSNNVRADRNIMFEALQTADVLSYSPVELKNDEEIVLKSVKHWPQSLQHASERLRDNKRVVLQAVKVDGLALKYASDRLKSDKKIVLAAIANNKAAIRCVPDEVLCDWITNP